MTASLSRPRRLLIAAVMSGALFSLFSTASARADTCQTRDTPYNWQQGSCLGLTGGIIGTASIVFRTGFNREGVKSCVLYQRLTSSYGTVHTHPHNCYSEAHLGGHFSLSYDWGPGRRAGDRYTQEVWMVVKTGVRTYDGYPWRATVTITK